MILDDIKEKRYKDNVTVQCDECQLKFTRTKKNIADSINHFCSDQCRFHWKRNRSHYSTSCKRCGITVSKKVNEKQKVKNVFCSKSCSAKHHNANKTYGTRRSKLEFWLEKQLAELYPKLKISYCQTDVIKAELDIYIPSLKLGFELNGIFHYEPIFGKDKLNRTQSNDCRKFAACQEKGIALCIIDTSQQKYFKTSTSKKYLDIIVKIIELHLAA